MTEDKLNNIRQQDSNLRNAILKEESVRPQMQQDLNARLMQRVAIKQTPRKKRLRHIWPWIAAACVAGIITIYLTPPKDNAPTSGEAIAKTDSYKIMPKTGTFGKAEPMTVIAKAEKRRQPVRTRRLTAKAETPTKCEAIKEETTAEIKVAHETHETASATPSTDIPRIISEEDLPITRPENYRYTQEEIALMKRQANEAYLKWAELEIEIAKYNLEQMAQK